ncbi:MAG: glycosyltransferase family 2 protein [Mucilaginibacter sp.]|nr:glycosyltransferase family 2 protein [Mucilaginibacter sp.]
MTTPLVSVIIPVYNGEKYIADTINSILAQTYLNIEIIVINDASTDRTEEIVNKFSLKHNILLKNNLKNIGASASRNLGYNNAKGQIIKFLDADDLINPEAVGEQVKLVSENPECVISGKWGRFYNDDVTTFRLNPENCWRTLDASDWICSSWHNAQSMTNPGIFSIPRNIVEKAGLWDERLSLIDDMEYFTKTILSADKVVFCENSTLYYRSGVENSLSGIKSRKAYQSAYLSLEKSTNTLLNKRSDITAKAACANLWQLFIYEIYPTQTDIASKALTHLKKLPAPTIKFPAGGLSKILLPFLGWRMLKKLQFLKHKKT